MKFLELPQLTCHNPITVSMFAADLHSLLSFNSFPEVSTLLFLTTHSVTCTCTRLYPLAQTQNWREILTRIKMSTLWCMKWYMLHSSWIQHCPVWLPTYWIFQRGGSIYSAVWWGLENKDWSLLCILSRSLKWIRLTSTSRGLVCQEALSYSCSTMPLPQSKFSWIAARQSALRAGSGPYMEVHPATKQYYIFSPLRNKKYNIYSPMTQNDYTMSAGCWKAYWSSRIDSLFFFGVEMCDIQSSLWQRVLCKKKTPPLLPRSSQSLISRLLMSNSLVSRFVSIIHTFPFVVKCF